MAGENLRKIQPGSRTSEAWPPNTQWDMDKVALPTASTRCQPSFRNLNEDSTIKEGLMRPLCVSGLAECLGLMTCTPDRVTSRSSAFLKTKEFSGWNIIDVLC